MLKRHASSGPKRQSQRSTKPRSGKSGIVPLVQAPMMRLLDQSLREVAIVLLHQTDEVDGEAPYCTTGRAGRHCSPRSDHDVWWGSGY
jgi:hypothetical protein